MDRNYYFDNLKLALIMLVVIGHLIAPSAGDSNSLLTLYLTIYSFHMPAFVFIAGYFSGSTKGLIKRLLIPYILFQTLYLFFNTPQALSNITYLLNPYGVMWFLPCLLIWKLSLKYIKINIYTIILNLIIAILIGYVSSIGAKYAISKLITFYPLFLLGYYFKGKKIDFGKKERLLSFFILTAYVLFIYFNAHKSTQYFAMWLYSDTSYLGMGHLEQNAGLYRLLVYSIYAITSICFMVLIPKKKYVFTILGRNTMTVYLLHLFAIRIILPHISFFSTINTPIRKIFLVIFGVAITILLSMLPVIIQKITSLFPKRNAKSLLQ